MKSLSGVYREEQGGSPGERTCFEEMRCVLWIGTLAEASQGFLLQVDLPYTVFFLNVFLFSPCAATEAVEINGFTRIHLKSSF